MSFRRTSFRPPQLDLVRPLSVTELSHPSFLLSANRQRLTPFLSTSSALFAQTRHTENAASPLFSTSCALLQKQWRGGGYSSGEFKARAEKVKNRTLNTEGCGTRKRKRGDGEKNGSKDPPLRWAGDSRFCRFEQGGGAGLHRRLRDAWPT